MVEYEQQDNINNAVVIYVIIGYLYGCVLHIGVSNLILQRGNWFLFCSILSSFAHKRIDTRKASSRDTAHYNAHYIRSALPQFTVLHAV